MLNQVPLNTRKLFDWRGNLGIGQVEPSYPEEGSNQAEYALGNSVGRKHCSGLPASIFKPVDN